MQNQLDNKVYAGFFVRFIAFAIDSLIAALVVSTIKSPFSLAAASGFDFLNANFLFHYSFLDVLDYVGVAAYFVLLTYFTHTTPGKAAMRLEVITMDKEWTMINVIYRETIGRFFSSLLCAGYFAVLISQKKQGFHDMLCDTYVVYKGMVPQTKEVSVVVNPMTSNDVISNAVENRVMENTSVASNLTEDTSIANPVLEDVLMENNATESNVAKNPVDSALAVEAVTEMEASQTMNVAQANNLTVEEISKPVYSEQPKRQEVIPPTYYKRPEE